MEDLKSKVNRELTKISEVLAKKGKGMAYYSQFGEDKIIVETILPLVRARSDQLTFIDIGAWDGVESSNTFYFEQLGWKGICVEPVRSAYLQCLKNRKCVCLNLACASKLEMREFYLNEQAPGLSGLNSSGTVQRMTTVRCDHLWHGFASDPPLLASIDTEGTELDVWEGFGELRPMIVVVEFWTQPHPPKDKELVERFVKDGYREVARTEANLIFVLTGRLSRA